MNNITGLIVLVTYMLFSVSVKAESVGALPGSLDVTQTGDLRYQIPIDLPQVGNGFSPQLGFGYNSLSPATFLGLGWSFSGISEIRRCAATEDQDGFQHLQNLSVKDRFCLDGQKLIANGAENYGKPNSEYRTFRDSYRKILLDENLNFLVFDRSGEISTYEPIGDGPTHWRIREHADRHGNYISFQYAKSSDTPYIDSIPLSIDFGGNRTSGLSHYRSVRFEYEEHHPNDILYRFGKAYKRSPLLKKIAIYSYENKIWDYRFQYRIGLSKQLTFLESVTKCVSDDDCLKPSKFEYDNDDRGEPFSTNGFLNILDSTNPGATWTRTTSVRTLIDLNKDGHLDFFGMRPFKMIMAYGSPDGFSEVREIESELAYRWQAARSPVSFGDIDRDGYSDIIIFTPDEVRIGYGDGESFPDILTFKDPELDMAKKPAHDQNSRFLQDFNNDGILDILAINAVSYTLYIGTGDRDRPFNEGITTRSDLGHIPADPRQNPRHIIDLNRDGFPDLLVFKNDAVVVALGSETGFLEPEAWSTDFLPGKGWLAGNSRRFFADVNADGIPDIVGNKHDGVWVALGTGYGFEPVSLWLSYFRRQDGWFPNSNFLVSFDVNGDDIADFVGFTARKIIVVLGNGASLSSPDGRIFEYSLPDRTSWDFKNDLVNFLTDFDNGRHGPILHTRMGDLYLRNNSPKNLLNRITDAYGRQHLIEWSSSLDPAIYRESFSQDYPIRSLAAHRPLVSSIQKTNGNGGLNRVSYKYYDGKLSIRGGGFLGFAKVEETDHASRNLSIKHYLQGNMPPTLGLPSKVENFQIIKGEKRLKRRINYEYRVRSDNNGYFQIYPESILTETYDENKQLLSQMSVTEVQDVVGNQLSSKTTITDRFGSYVTEITNQFDEDNYENWLIGRVTFAQSKTRGPHGPEITRKAKFSYDQETGEIIKETKYSGSDDELTKTFAYDPVFGHIITQTTRLKNFSGFSKSDIIARYEFDELGFLKASINAKGHRTHYSYHNDFGTRIRSIDPNGQSSNIDYDMWSRVRSEWTSHGSSSNVSWEYCDEINGSCEKNEIIKQISSANDGSELINYLDRLERVVREETLNFDGKRVFKRFGFRDNGLQEKTSKPFFEGDLVYWTQIDYDDYNRVAMVENPDGSKKRFRYQGFERIEIDDLGHETRYLTNALKQTLLVTNAKGEKVKYTYDSRGNLTKILNPAGQLTELFYDEHGRMILLDDPAAGVSRKYYNSLDMVYRSQDADGIEVTYGFDNLARKVSKTYSKVGKILSQESWIYDESENGIGQLSVASKGSYSQSYQYDAKARIKSLATSFAGQSYFDTYIYDELSRLKEKNFASGEHTAYQYGPHGDLIEITDKLQKNTLWSLNETTASGSIIGYNLGKNISIKNEFDPKTGLLRSTQAKNSTDALLHDLSFDFDSLGNLREKKDQLAGHREFFDYDQLNRLIVAGSNLFGEESYRYDVLGNLIEKNSSLSHLSLSYQSNCGGTTNGQKLCYLSKTSSTGATEKRNFSYDKSGKILSDGVRRFEYAPGGKLSRVDSVGKTTGFVYGPDERRIERFDELGGDTTLTRYVGDGSELSIKDGESVWRTAIAPGVIATKTANARKLHFQLTDHLGNILKVVDESGIITERYDYDPWGAKRKDAFSVDEIFARTSLRGFTGHEQIDSQNLIHMNGRVYHPEIGRFTSPDAFIQDSYNLQSLNRYSYVWNNPLTNTDPSGHFSIGNFLGGLAGFVTGLGDMLGINSGLERLSSWTYANRRQIYSVAIMAASWYAGGYFGAMEPWLMAGGFTSGYVASDGDVGVAMVSLVTAVAFYGVGEGFQSPYWAGSQLAAPAKVASHGFVGGSSSVLLGGDFESGFMSAAVSEAFTQFGTYEALGAKTSDLGIADVAWNAVVAGAVGGTVSRITGGSFENGFATAAYGRLFNELYHLGKPHDEAITVYDDEIEICTGDGIKHAAVGKIYRSGLALEDDIVTEIVATGFIGGVRAGVRSLVTSKNPNGLVTVTRWGRPGLESGDWVMKGGKTWKNYTLSGKGQPQWLPGNNIPAPISSGQTFFVPKQTLRFPINEGGKANPLNYIKYGLGQRQYIP
ncbi:MAG: RHS repeat-associated core domain-containing protein [Oligoflexus sp.]